MLERNPETNHFFENFLIVDEQSVFESSDSDSEKNQNLIDFYLHDLRFFRRDETLLIFHTIKLSVLSMQNWFVVHEVKKYPFPVSVEPPP